MAESTDSDSGQVHGQVETMPGRENCSEFCEPCSVGDITHNATGWCETCDELLCNDCYQSHCRPKLMRGHQLRSIADMRSLKQRTWITSRCGKHEGEQLKYFCETHAQLGCGQCLFNSHRPCKQVVCINEVKTCETTEFKALEKLLSDLGAKLVENEETVVENEEMSASHHNKAIEEIEETGQKLKTHIDKLVKEQILKVKKIMNDDSTRMAEIKETNKAIGDQVQKCQEMIVAEKEDNTQLFITMKHLKGEAKLLEAELDKVRKKNSFVKYDFVVNSELAKVLEKVTELGQLVDTNIAALEKTTNSLTEVHEVWRFDRTSMFCDWNYDRILTDVLHVAADTDIQLLYILLYPCYGVKTKLRLVVKEGQKQCAYINTFFHATSEETIAVTLTNGGVLMKANVTYKIEVTMNGQSSCQGRGGQSEINANGVKFTFNAVPGLGIRSDISEGQIPGLGFARL